MIPSQNPSTTALPAARATPPGHPDPASQMPPRVAHATDSHEGDALDDFDLRDLADGPVPDGDLLSGIGIPGLDVPGRDPLGDLLNGVPGRKATARDAAAPLAHSATQPTSGILAELREEFDRVARDPAQLGNQTVWQGLQAAGDDQALTLAQLQRKAQAYRSPHHMMLPNLGIDALIEAVGPSEGVTLVDPEEQIDVLHLFAADLLRDTPRTIPSLTRVEHHAVALDSPVATGGVRTSPEAPS